ncbi:MAG: hypothetical protein FJZ66_04100 [Bacteroidetes bacterium]|nr:hypothetical protein [Bacteroidota bacterium]
MKNCIIFICIFSCSWFYSQRVVSISIQGYVKNYSTNKNIFGSTLYLQQNDKLISKAVSESNGEYLISGKINIAFPFELVSSKSGFITKKVLFDLKTLIVKNTSSPSVKILPRFTFQLYEDRPNTDLSFASKDYAERLFWDQEKYCVISDGKEKELSRKVELAYNNLSVKVQLSAADSIQKLQDDATIEKQIQLVLSNANSLEKAGKYADAITEYSKVQLLTANVFNEQKFSKYLASAASSIQDVKVKKDAEELAFKGQIKLAKEKIALGRMGLNTANSVLKSEPMKSRSSDPEVTILKDQIAKLQQYYKDKDAAYKLLKTNKNTPGALIALQNVFSTATNNSEFTISSEITQLKKSIDSLNNILNPTLNQTIATSNQPTNVNRLSSPGQKFNGSAKDAFNNLDNTTQLNTSSKQEQMENAVNEVAYENSLNKKLNESRAIDAAVEIDKRKDVKDRLAREEDSLQEIRQFQMEEATLKNEYEKYKLDSLNLMKTYVQARQLEQLQTEKELHDINEKEKLEITHERHKEMVDNHNNQMQMQREEDLKNQLLRQVDMENAKNDVEKALYSSHLENEKKQEQRMYDQQQMIEDKPVLQNQPNFLADSDGNIYKNDSTYEEVYELKNEQGFVETVIIRRIIVDHYGYGLVYEQTKNAKGICSYTRNGFPITEFEWQNESKRKSPFKK